MKTQIIKKQWLMFILNVCSLILLGIVLQIGGAYIVNAAVECLASSGDGSTVSSAAEAAYQYMDYMEYIRSIEPRRFAHIIFVSPLVEEIVFRLIFLRAGKMVLPFWAANIVQSLMFALYHNVTIQRVYVFVMGLIIGAVFYYCPIIYRRSYAGDEKSPDRTVSGHTDNSSKGLAGLLDLPNCLMGVAASFILHMVINSAALFLIPFFPADISLALKFAIGGVMMAIAGAAVYYLYKQQAAGGGER